MTSLKKHMDIKKLLTNSFLVLVGSFVGGVFAYGFNMVMGRMLGPEKYGEMTTVLSMVAITSVGGGAILTVVTYYSSEVYNKNAFSALKRMHFTFTKYIFFISFFLFLIGLFLSGPLSRFFNLSSPISTMIAFLGLIFGFLILVNKGVLQGVQNFSSLTILNTFEMVLRLILGVILVKIGFATLGAVSAVILALIISYGLTFLPINKLFKKTVKKDESAETKNLQFNKKDILLYSIPTALAMAVMAIGINVDVMFIKHYFSPADAGMYAAISTIGKVILYVTAPIVTVMFPMIAQKRVTGDKHYKILLFSLAITILLSLFILTFYELMPGRVISLFYGSAYVGMYSLLPRVGFFIFFYTLVNLIINYFLSIKSFKFLWPLFITVLLQIVLVSIWHGSLVLITSILTTTMGLLFLCLMSYYLFTKKEQIILLLKGDRLES